jgi:hypothetical protein
MEDARLILKDEVYQLVGCAMEVLNGTGMGLQAWNGSALPVKQIRVHWR